MKTTEAYPLNSMQSVGRFAGHEERKMKLSNTLALAFAISLACPIAAYAQTAEQPTPQYQHHVRRHVHHHVVAPNGPPAPVVTAAPAPVVPSVPPLFRPAPPSAVEHDSDGLSRDPEDCMMGCLDTTD